MYRIQSQEHVAQAVIQYSQALAQNEAIAELSLEAKDIRGAQAFARAVGEELSKAFVADVDIAAEVLETYVREMLKADHAAVAQCCEAVQAVLFSRLGLQLQAVPIALDEGRVSGLATIASEKGLREIATEQLINFSLAVVDQSVKANARSASSLGVPTKVIRVAHAGACPWCKGLEGTYDYASVSAAGSDVWLRHERCRCLIDVRYSRAV